MRIFILVFVLFPSLGFSNPIHLHSYRNIDLTYNFFIEIPAGTKEKWEVKKSGELEWKEKNGIKRTVDFLSYPGNYGFIPQTLAGDNDPIDVIDLDSSSSRGSLLKIKILGGMYFMDKNEEDIKFIGVSSESNFSYYESLEQLALEKPAILEILKHWFESYKEPGKMVFYKFLTKEESEVIINKAHEKWKNNSKEYE